MSTEENKTIAKRFLEEALVRGNLVVVDELLPADYKYHMLNGQEFEGTEGVKQFVAIITIAFPDAHISIDDVIAEGDKVVCRYTVGGTHQGDFMGVAPTGKQFTFSGIVISRIEDGKIVEDWESINPLTEIQQRLGIIPPVGQGK